MDTLTHALSGALLARATEPHVRRADQLPRHWRMLVGFLTAAFPDSDFIFNFADPLTYLSMHRGVTHSIILLPLWAALLALIFFYLARKRYPWKAFVGMCALGVGAHIAGDVITAFGTMIFAPFSNWRLQLPTTFIIDLYFSGIIVLGLIASAIWRRTRAPAVIALGALASLVAFEGFQHQRAVAVGAAYIDAQRLDGARAQAIPQPLSPFNWLVVVEQEKTYHLATINLVRDETLAPSQDAGWLARIDASYSPVKNAHWLQVSRYGTDDESLVETVWRLPSLARYRDFAMFPALLRIEHAPERTCVWFNDLRFLMAERVNPFRYGACQRAGDMSWKVYRLVDAASGDLLNAIPD